MKPHELRRKAVNGEEQNTYKVDDLTAHNGALSASEVYRNVLADCPDVLNVPQVSAVLGISSKTTYRLLNTGELISLKIGREFKIPKVFVLQYLKVLAQN